MTEVAMPNLVIDEEDENEDLEISNLDAIDNAVENLTENIEDLDTNTANKNSPKNDDKQISESPEVLSKGKDEFIKENSNPNTTDEEETVVSFRKNSIIDSDTNDNVEDDSNNKIKYKKKAAFRRSAIIDSDSSDEESTSSFSETKIPSKEAKNFQQMSTKDADEQRKRIKSETQRLVRETYVNIPYHRPRKFTLQEFLNRKTVMNLKSSNLKMTPEELEQYSKYLDARAKEAEEFFKSESDIIEKDNCNSGSNLKDKNDLITEQNIENIGNLESGKLEDKIEDEDEYKSNEETVENPKIDKNEESSSNIKESSNMNACSSIEEISDIKESSEQPKSASNFFENLRETIQTDSKPASLKLPQLKQGTPDENVLIDLETGCVIPQKPSGVENLFKRFLSHSTIKRKPKTTATVKILSTENQKIEISDTVIKLTNDEDSFSRTEQKPGALHLKLKENLKKLIYEKRKTEIAKRHQESQEILENKKNDESGDDIKKERKQKKDKTVKEIHEKNKNIKENCEKDTNNHQNNENKENISLIHDGKTEYENAENIDEGSENESDVVEDEDEEIGSDNDEEIDETDDEINDADDEQNDEETDDEQNDEETDDEQNDGETDVEEEEQIFLKRTTKTTRKPNFFDDSDDDEEIPNGQNNNHLLIEKTEETGIENEKLSNSSFEPTQITDTDQQQQLMISQVPTAPLSQDIDENELMGLCSGAFTNAVESEKDIDVNKSQVQETEIPDTEKLKVSGDEDEVPKRKFKRIRNIDEISDDEESGSSDNEVLDDEISVDDDDDDDIQDEDNQEESESGQEEEQEAETYIDYDSEENEIEVKLKKDHYMRKAGDYFEQEAELSGSEWGSEDEDEGDLDKDDDTEGLIDNQQFDENELQSELGKIHMRKMLDQDNRELRKLQELFFEDEENDGIGRQRQFRWAHLQNAGLNLDVGQENNGEGGEENEIENELLWRKMRFERQQLLKELQEKNTQDTTSQVITPQDIKKKLTIIKTTKVTTNTSLNYENNSTNISLSSPFLISKSIQQTTNKSLLRGSFLTRDKETLSSLTTLTKITGVPEDGDDGEIMNIKTSVNRRNFVFSVLSDNEDDKEKVTTGKRKMFQKQTTENGDNEQKIKKRRLLKNEKSNKKKGLIDQLM